MPRPRLLTDDQPKSRSWWGKDYGDLDVYTAALNRARDAFAMFDHIFVSFSGGKDSTAVLNVALEVAHEFDALPLRVVFWDEEAISLETEAYVRQVAARPDVALDWYCLPVRHRNACSDESPWWWPWDPSKKDLWVRPMPPEAISELPGFPVEPEDARPSIPAAAEALISSYATHGNVGQMMGIRAQESMIRRVAVSNSREDNWIINCHTGFAKVYPIYDWNTVDVWTAPADHGWDYNPSYDVMEMAGISHNDQRLAPPYGEEPMRILWMWKSCFPDVWDKMVNRVPGAAAAARYSRSPLYNYQQRLRKPAGVTWQEFIRQRIMEHPPELRSAVAGQVRRKVMSHASKTTEPLVGFAIHPRSGISWERIYYIADKGDLKSRWSAFPRMKLDPESMAEYRRAYEAELATFGDGRG